jgi:hypothetical protein
MSKTRNKLANGVIDLERATLVKIEVEDDIDDLAKKKFGWNGAHALPVRQDVVAEIKHRLLSHYGMDLRCLAKPDLIPGKDGTVAIIFRHGMRKLKLHVLCHAVVHCFAEDCQGGSYTLDKLVRMAQGAPATGYAAEIDEWADWLLGLEKIG